MTLAPSLGENWFVEDALESGLHKHPLLALIDADPETALRKCYKLSRGIRINHLLAGRFTDARDTTNTDTLNFLGTTAVLIAMAAAQFDAVQQNIDMGR
jgi:hypothetical protein